MSIIGTRRRKALKLAAVTNAHLQGDDDDPFRSELSPLGASSLSDVDVSEMSSEESERSQPISAEKKPASPPPPRKERRPTVDSLPAKTIEKPSSSTSSWTDIDPSVFLALAAPIGSWLTGGDHLKSLFLVLFLVVYLHQLITVPWELYQAARTRRPHPPFQSPASASTEPPETARLRKTAATELQRHEVGYLVLSATAPFLGAYLLRAVLKALSGADEISWFSTTLFVLATGIRPWSHLITRLRERTHSLHDAVHYPSPELQLIADEKLQAVLDRVVALEDELTRMKSIMASHARVEEVYNDLSGGLDDVERVVKKNERKSDTTRIAHDSRLLAVEKGVSRALEKRPGKKNAVSTSSLPPYAITQGARHPHTARVFAALVHALFFFWSILTLNFLRKSVLSPPTARRRSNRAILPHRAKSPRRLETILEDTQELAASPDALDSGSDCELADTEGPEGEADDDKAGSKTMVDVASEVVLFPYRWSLRIILAVAPVFQRILR